MKYRNLLIPNQSCMDSVSPLPFKKYQYQIFAYRHFSEPRSSVIQCPHSAYQTGRNSSGRMFSHDSRSDFPCRAC